MENQEENSQKFKKRKHNKKPNEVGKFETSIIETKMENHEENSRKGKKRKPKEVAMENQEENSQKGKKRKPKEVAVENQEENSQKSKKRKHNEKPNEVANVETSIIETKMENQEENSQKSKKRKHNEKPNEVANFETSVIETKMENHEENSQKGKKRKPKEVAVFGNYRNYYGYRLAGDIKQDPRFKVLKKEWFEGKDCLDIGCNQGLITIEIARKFCCRSIVGVDIDNSLVESSYWNLKRISKMEDVSCRSSDGSVSDHSEKTNDLEANKTAMSTNAKTDKNLFERVSFHKENFVKNLYPYKEKYDTILCLSVTKWIHLNWGDDGLITLFANMWRLLRPGGILILEPQPWKSYQKNYLVSERTQSNYYDITVHPCIFQEVLLDKIGFRTVKNITENVPGSAAGFNRPIFLFGK